MYDVNQPEFCGYQRGHQNALETYAGYIMYGIAMGMGMETDIQILPFS